MDFQAQVAARRAQLEQQQRAAQKAAAEETRARQAAAAEQARAKEAAAQAQREEALDVIATDLSQHGTDVVRVGDELALANPPIAALDVEAFRRAKVKRLLQREARKMWTPSQNWQVIGLIVSGVFLITAYGLGLLLILAGLMRRSAFNARYAAEIRHRYPAIFPTDASDQSPAPV